MKGLSTALPKEVETYLFCSPALDGMFRCLPKSGGYYDQNYHDVLCFRIIEQRLAEIQKRTKKNKEK